METLTTAILVLVIQFVLIPVLLLLTTPYILIAAIFKPGPYLEAVQEEYHQMYVRLRGLFRK